MAYGAGVDLDQANTGLGWTDPNSGGNNEDGFTLQGSLDATDFSTPVVAYTPGANVTSQLHIGNSGAKLFWRIRAFKNSPAEVSAWSNIVWPTNTPVDKVVRLSAEVVTGGIKISWAHDYNEGLQSVAIWRKLRGGNDWGDPIFTAYATFDPPDGDYYVDLDVDAGEAYEYQVKQVTTLSGTRYGYIFVGQIKGGHPTLFLTISIAFGNVSDHAPPVACRTRWIRVSRRKPGQLPHGHLPQER